jgi:hypothetical protein
MMKLATTLTLIVTLATPALAEPAPNSASALQRLIGNWRGPGSMAVGAENTKIHASWSCKNTSAKFGVLCSFKVTGIPGVPVYDETDLIGYEPNTDTFHWYAVTNAGETHDHVASHQPLEFVFEGSQGGKPLKEVIRLSFAADGTLEGHAETFVAGQSASVLSLQLRKSKP